MICNCDKCGQPIYKNPVILNIETIELDGLLTKYFFFCSNECKENYKLQKKIVFLTVNS